jgi:crossover junction endodeoxyribonuclease RuvC
VIILGIDPGIATTGLGIIEAADARQWTARDWLTIDTSPSLTLAERLAELAADLDTVLTEHHPDLAVVERIFFSRNVRSAIEVAHARGVVLAALAVRHIAVIEATPRELKLAVTGDGNADKRQIQEMLMRLLRLTEVPKPDDAADALALALYGAAHAPFSQAVSNAAS